ncbi:MULTISPECIES: hypothetical protein [unclassified Streptomyces]|nr:hypothetical protein [Streptomyces sp. CB09001]
MTLPDRREESVEVYVQGARHARGPWTAGAMLNAAGPASGGIRIAPAA